MPLNFSDKFASYDEKTVVQSHELDTIHSRIHGLVDLAGTIAERLSKVNDRVFGSELEKESKTANRPHGSGMIGCLNEVVSRLDDLLIHIKTSTDQLERL